MRNFINNTNSTVVVLNNNWKERLQPYIGYCNVISNPIDPMIIHDRNLQRDTNLESFKFKNWIAEVDTVSKYGNNEYKVFENITF